VVAYDRGLGQDDDQGQGQNNLRSVQGQVEKAAIKTNLGGLRMAFVIDHLALQTASIQPASEGASPASGQRNPFLLLQRMPANYAGEMPASETAALPRGSWVFDPACPCIGYRPLYPEWLSSPKGEQMLWFNVTGASPPYQLAPRMVYVWKGEVLN
jgi:hypothetical protein